MAILFSFTAIAALAVAVSVYVILSIVYNLFFHPLRSFPGPLFNRISVLPKVYWLFNGVLAYRVADLHATYGHVIRICPNELAFTDPKAWKDVYARRGGGRYEIPHDPDFYNAIRAKDLSIIQAGREDHDTVRKLLSPGFSDRAMKAQAPMFHKYVTLLVRRLSEHSVDAAGRPKSVNMRDWFAYTTFDVIGKLAFGSDFGCLEGATYHPWVHLIIGSVRDLAILQALKSLGVLTHAIRLMRLLGMGDKKRQSYIQLTVEKTKQRIALGTGQDDFLDELIKADLPFDMIMRNSALLIVAGSETTATLLAGVTYFLTTNPELMENLKAEVRSRFSSEDEITITSVNSLTYMLAVLNEALRMYPPVPYAALRRVGPGGAHIAGHYVPEDCVVGVWQWAENHNPELFQDPDKFDPERWYETSENRKYANDRLDAVNPFLLGPRNCLGQNLAIAEMRLILARLMWNFDMTISGDSKDWMANQKIYLLWEKPDLQVYLTPAKR